MLYTLIHSFVLSLLLSLFFFFFLSSSSSPITGHQNNTTDHGRPECVYAFVLYCIIVLYYYSAFLHAIVSCLSQVADKATLYGVSLACP